MTTLQSRLEDIDARLANAQNRLSEAERELANLRQLGHPTRAVELGLTLMSETMESMVAVRHLSLRNFLSDTEVTLDNSFLLTQAARCRDLASTAIKFSIRQGLTDIANELERAAEADSNLSSSV
jgi:hypothetical protein